MDKTLRVFVPYELPACPKNGHLVGWHQILSQNNNRQLVTVFIFALIPYENPLPVSVGGHGQSRVHLLGSFERWAEGTGTATVPPPPASSLCSGDVRLNLRLTATHRLDVAGVRVGDTLLQQLSECCDLVLYDPTLFTRLNPEIISPAVGGTQRRSKMSLIQTLSTALGDFRVSPLSEAPGIVDFVAMDGGSSSLTASVLASASNALSKCVAVIASFSCKVFRKSGLASLVDRTSKFSVCAQLKTRFLQLEFLGRSETSPGQEMRFWNTLAAIFFDFFLGLLLTAVLYKAISTVLLLDIFLEWTNAFQEQKRGTGSRSEKDPNVRSTRGSVSRETDVERVDDVGNLRSLLTWMMGNPAGFKLNHRLSSSMGTFFTYHIYLWEAYLYIIKPALEVMLAMVLYCGTLGLTFQLGMLNDLFTFATFHVYCFYAYAAKLYHLNFVGLISYWRLFRGKKWNPLRQRVDSCTYDVDQLFMGTLCFTTLLFLLPTTLLYYAVFTILRIPILLLQGIIHKTMGFINQLPLCTMFLYIIGSRSLVGKVNFTVVPGNASDGPLIVAMKGESCSCSVAVFRFLPPVTPRDDKITGWPLLKDLMTGKLIYPI